MTNPSNNKKNNMDPYIFAGDGNTHLTGDKLHAPGNIPSVKSMAHALSQINRFTGHTIRPYNVAEHSLLVCEIARNQPYFNDLSVKEQGALMLACLVHDLHEALVGDVPTPIKRMLGEAWYEFEDEVELAVLNFLGLTELTGEWRDRVKHCDLLALATEKRDLLPGCSEGHTRGWSVLEGIEAPAYLSLPPFVVQGPTHWRDFFVECYTEARSMWETGVANA